MARLALPIGCQLDAPRAGASFRRYTALVTAVAALAMAALAVGTEPALGFGDPRLWLFAAFVVVGDLLPIRVPRQDNYDEVTVSSAFALAVLFTFGVAEAVAVYVGSVLVAGALERTEPVKVVFNAAQYALALALSGLVLTALEGSTPVAPVAGNLLGIGAAAAVFFAANNLLAGTGAALIGGEPVGEYLRRDVVLLVWTAGFPLALAPVIVAAAESSLWLVPLLFLPLLAIYLGGGQAVINAHRALHDQLTDLPNRALLDLRFDAALAAGRREGARTVVAMIDLDGFKAVNDTLGHHHGDLLLQQVAGRLGDALGPHDTLARLGGDEFVVVHPDGDDELRLGERLVGALEEPFEVDGLRLDVRASVGLAVFPDHGSDRDELLQHADVALYRAKEQHSVVEVYAPEEDEPTIDRLVLAGQLRRAIHGGELVLHYQPKRPLGAGEGWGVEALVRWQHPHLGMIGPQGFIPLAEETRLIRPLTTWVIEEALTQCVRWREEGLHVRVSVNLCACSLLDRGLPGWIAAELRRRELPASVLQLEITESRLLADLPLGRRVLEELREIGVGAAIDDFGTGYASLVSLHQLPVDEIKIDRSFVLGLGAAGVEATIVRSTVDLAQSLGIAVTAEGVESDVVLRRLERLGCDFAQGFAICRPVPPDECRAFVERAIAAQREVESEGRSPAATHPRRRFEAVRQRPNRPSAGGRAGSRPTHLAEGAG